MQTMTRMQMAYQYQKLIVCDIDCSPTEPLQRVH